MGIHVSSQSGLRGCLHGTLLDTDHMHGPISRRKKQEEPTKCRKQQVPTLESPELILLRCKDPAVWAGSGPGEEVRPGEGCGCSLSFASSGASVAHLLVT